jgi:hypothetical protein
VFGLAIRRSRARRSIVAASIARGASTSTRR